MSDSKFDIGDMIEKKDFEEDGDSYIGCIVEDKWPEISDLDVKYKPRWGVRFMNKYPERIYYFQSDEIVMYVKGDGVIPISSDAAASASA